jgi:hypothetical protein
MHGESIDAVADPRDLLTQSWCSKSERAGGRAIDACLLVVNPFARPSLAQTHDALTHRSFD